MEARHAMIGPSIHVKGELLGSEDLVIEGRVEGTIRLPDHQLTVGKNAVVEASIEAKAVRIEGKLKGDVKAGEKVELATGSEVLGDIATPRMIIADGARFKGSIDMDRAPARPVEAPKAAAVTSPAPVATTTAPTPAGAGRG